MARPRKSDEAANERERPLRAMPPLDECLAAAVADETLARLSRERLKTIMRRAQEAMRRELIAGASASSERAAIAAEIVRRARDLALNDEPAIRTVINATGVVIHTNLGRSALAEAAIEAVATAARSAINLEYDIESGARGDRDLLVEEDLRELTGAEAATVVNNNAAAVLLALNTLARGREVIVSRGELVEIGGAFRIPDVMERSGARLREVGTTNRTHPADFSSAIGADTALLMKVHPSNYRVVGFTAEVTLAEMVAIGRAREVDVIEDLGAGALIDMSAYGLAREPVVRERIAAGAGLVTFSGDKLLGGPQAGIIVGRRALIDRLKANPLKRALRCDKLTLAALAATLRLYLRSPDIAAELPALRLLRRTPAEIEEVAARARAILAARLGADFKLEIAVAFSEVGSGALPAQALESRAIRITHPALSPDAVAGFFRRARPPVIGRVSGGAFQIDLRTIEDAAALAVRFPERA
jgi:L-seryl-tRNA(Ser) seleniumtransferase